MIGLSGEMLGARRENNRYHAEKKGITQRRQGRKERNKIYIIFFIASLREKKSFTQRRRARKVKSHAAEI